MSSGTTPRTVSDQHVEATCDCCTFTTESTARRAGALGNAARHAKANPGHEVECTITQTVRYKVPE